MNKKCEVSDITSFTDTKGYHKKVKISLLLNSSKPCGYEFMKGFVWNPLVLFKISHSINSL